ncbi:hypothetical protein EDB81DRAFT_196215 [Dactylonectria macrodidyma]|uniref:Uncharacterized protein n=1 Tax=Dactylonectria macrodidyma TaxID=307937 RepID=A0A9P9JMA6_9HYPO|nr:hypothetical protein EDB81DRAFT_196215 [Dactylonectria macrodidyma]
MGLLLVSWFDSHMTITISICLLPWPHLIHLSSSTILQTPAHTPCADTALAPVDGSRDMESGRLARVYQDRPLHTYPSPTRPGAAMDELHSAVFPRGVYYWRLLQRCLLLRPLQHGRLQTLPPMCLTQLLLSIPVPSYSSTWGRPFLLPNP